MRCDRLYLDEVVNTQGDLFKIAYNKGYNILEFGEQYLKSDIRSFIDCGVIEYCTMKADKIFELINIQELVHDIHGVDKKELEKDIWIGKFYAISQWYGNVASKVLITKMKLEDVYTYYKTLSSMDMEIASKLYLKSIKIL